MTGKRLIYDQLNATNFIEKTVQNLITVHGGITVVLILLSIIHGEDQQILGETSYGIVGKERMKL